MIIIKIFFEIDKVENILLACSYMDNKKEKRKNNIFHALQRNYNRAATMLFQQARSIWKKKKKKSSCPGSRLQFNSAQDPRVETCFLLDLRM